MKTFFYWIISLGMLIGDIQLGFAHNGVVATAVNIDGITIDGDFSDWPEGLETYPIEDPAFGEPPTDEFDFDAYYRIGYNEVQQVLYVAVTVQDDYTVIDTTDMWNTQDGCEIYAYLNHLEVPSSSERGAYSTLQFSIYGDSRLTYGKTKLRSPYLVEVLRFGNTTQYEWLVNVGQLAHGIRHLSPNSAIAIDIVVVDKDKDENFSWMTWGPGVNKWGFADRLGDILLVSDKSLLSNVSGKVHWSNEEAGNKKGFIYLSAVGTKTHLRVKPDTVGVFSAQLPAMEYSFQAGYRRHLSESVSVKVPPSSDVSLPPLSFLDPPFGERSVIKAIPSVVAGEGSKAGDWSGYNIHDGMPGNEVTAISMANSGVMLLGTQNGMSFFDGSTFSMLTESDGLAGNQVSFFKETSDGALWIATSAGISRYINDEIITYTALDGLAGNWVTSILEDDDGVLWTGSLHGGVSQFNGESFEKIETGHGFSVRDIVQDRNGIIWIATTRGLTSFDGEEFLNYTMEDGLPSDDITALYEASDGKLWVGTKPGVDGGKWEMAGGAFFIEDGTINLAPSLFEDPTKIPEYDEGYSRREVLCLSEDSFGNMWIGTAGGLFRVKDQTVKQLVIGGSATDINVKSLFHDGVNQLWVGTNEGIWRYDGAVYSSYSLSQLNTTETTSIIEDDKSRIWVGTNNGIQVIQDGKIIGEKIIPELPDLPVEYLYQSLGQGLWIGTPSSIYQHRNGRLREFPRNIIFGENTVGLTDDSPVAKSSLFDSSYVRSIYQDRKGTVWVSVVDGLFRFKEGTFSLLTTSDGLGSNEINSVFEDSKGILWVATSNGMSKYDGTSFRNYTTEDGLPSNWINAITESSNGNIWAATTQGISSFDGSKFKNIKKRDGLSGSQATALFFSADSTLWVKTEKGVSFLKDGALSVLTMVQGLPSNEVNVMKETSSGVKWLGTNEGISRYDGETVQNLLKRDGLNSNLVKDLLETRNGDYWILTDMGVTRIRPESSDPRILISSIVADDIYKTGMQIEIPTTQRQVAINFQGLSFQTRRKLINYTYRLKGYDKGWQFSRENVAYYENLPSGIYEFEVKGIDRAFNYSKQPASVKFEVIYVPEASSIGLGEIEVLDIFASFYKTYGIRPAGQAQIFNKNEIPIKAVLQYYLPELMKRPTQREFTIPPTSKIILPFRAQLDNSLLNVIGQQAWEAEVELSYNVGERTVSVEKRVPLKVHGRGALTWNSMAKAAVFVTPEHAPVVDFSRGLLSKFEDSHAKNVLNKNIQRAILMFEGLNTLGVKYAPDANTPFQKTRGDVVALDNIQYPFELLKSRLGDCDDNTVLYCSLLENLNIRTAFVDVPGHILMMFDSGIPNTRTLGPLLPESMFVDFRNTMWIPIEVTVLGEDRLFLDAWELGAKILKTVDTSEPGVITIVSDAWNKYPYGDLQEEYSIDWPEADLLKKNLRDNLDRIGDLRSKFFEVTYIRPLLGDPNNDLVRLNMAKSHIESEEFNLALGHLPLVSGKFKAQALYLIGYSYAGLGDYENAAKYVEQALEMDPQHTGYMESLCWIYYEMISNTSDI